MFTRPEANCWTRRWLWRSCAAMSESTLVWQERCSRPPSKSCFCSSASGKLFGRSWPYRNSITAILFATTRAGWRMQDTRCIRGKSSRRILWSARQPKRKVGPKVWTQWSSTGFWLLIWQKRCAIIILDCSCPLGRVSGIIMASHWSSFFQVLEFYFSWLWLDVIWFHSWIRILNVNDSVLGTYGP